MKKDIGKWEHVQMRQGHRKMVAGEWQKIGHLQSNETGFPGGDNGKESET